ncbi:MAG: hypothetical protein ACOZAA_06505 [Pseudomonadota bacterium]
MSDISINFAWYELLAVSPALGWPGLLAGGALGAALWRRRRIWGGVLGAIAGDLAVFAARILLM